MAQDYIGLRGENMCNNLLTKFCPGRELPFFKPIFLGEKFQTLDFMVELVGAGEITPFFFIQVKTTREGYTKRDRRLKVKVSQEAMSRLRAYPAPTYVVGIGEVQEKGYIISANAGSSAVVSSLPTTFALDCSNLARLWQEVRDYWRQRDMDLKDSLFAA